MLAESFQLTCPLINLLTPGSETRQMILLVNGGGPGVNRLKVWHLTTERQWLLRNLFSQETYKKDAWMVL